MGISLNGLTPAGTYPGLIKTGDNTAISGTPKVLSDGNGNNLPMEVSTTGVNFTNNLTQGGTALQPVLVSGTNIKTINGASLLGSGNIPVVTSPSGVSGAIQFSNGSAFASDAANLFWDDTNNRLGIGTNAPSATTHIKGSGATSATTSLLVQNSAGTDLLRVRDDGSVITSKIVNTSFESYSNGVQWYLPQTISGTGRTFWMHSWAFGGSSGTPTGLTISGDVNQSATAGFRAIALNLTQTSIGSGEKQLIDLVYNSNRQFNVDHLGNMGLSVASQNASAKMQIDSTTSGFLPPRMTTTQKNAIASPAAGLVVYDSTTNKLQCYNGSTWNDLF
jgi:hypothetical protein